MLTQVECVRNYTLEHPPETWEDLLSIAIVLFLTVWRSSEDALDEARTFLRVQNCYCKRNTQALPMMTGADEQCDSSLVHLVCHTTAAMWHEQDAVAHLLAGSHFGVVCDE